MKYLFLISFLFLSKLVLAGEIDSILYISDIDDKLYKVSKLDGGIRLIGHTGVPNIEAIAYVPKPGANALYATNQSTFGTVSLSTGAFTPINDIGTSGTANGASGPMNFTDIDGLMLDGQTFILWASHRVSNGADVLFHIDTVNGTFIRDAFGPGVDYLVIDGNGALADVDDIAVSPLTGRMYVTSNNGGQNDVLLRINKYTASFEFGVTLTEDDMEGISFDNVGHLYGVEGDDSRLSDINIETGLVNDFKPLIGGDPEAIAALIVDANTMAGSVYSDLNLNGVKDAGETGIQNVKVYLYIDINNNGSIDPEDRQVQSTLTDVNGDYHFLFASTANLLTTTVSSTYPSGFALTTNNVENAIFADNINFSEVENDNNFGLASGADCDGDGIPDFYEGNLDSDGDGILNKCDLDSDNDGIRDDVEGTEDFDNDGVPNYIDRDSDDDGIPDAIEANQGAIPNGYVAAQGNISGAVGTNGIVDAIETSVDSGTMLAPNPDSDGDGNRDVLDLDSDNDGILDITEVGGTDIDFDGQIDGFIDNNNNGYEDNLENNPLVITNSDSIIEVANGSTILLPNYIDYDSDNDGIDDTREGYSTNDYSFPVFFNDQDGDGIFNNFDVSNFGTPIIPNDQDQDGTPDYMDADSDNDGISDFIEGNDANSDGVADLALSGLDADLDGLDDAFETPGGLQNNSTASDHAEERVSNGAMNLGSSDLELMTENPTGGNLQTVAVRFDNINIDQGQAISNAYIQFTTDEVTTGSVTITIEAHKVVNPSGFNTTDHNISSRTPRTASKTWSPANWNTIGESGAAQRTVDISDLINEITALGSWVNGNSIVIIFSGTDNTARTAEVNPVLVYYTPGSGGYAASTVAHQDFDGDGEDDFRDVDDDDDQILTVDEQTDADGSGQVDYLEVDAGVCGVGYVNSGGGTTVYAEYQSDVNSVHNATKAEGAPDGAYAEIYNNNQQLILDFGSIFPAGTKYEIVWRRRNDVTSGTAIIDLSESNSATSGFTNHPTSPTNSDNVNWTTTVVTSNVSFRYLAFDKGNSSTVDYEIDAVVIPSSGCLLDSDFDGIANVNDLDDDNDGISDTTEGGGDTDGDGIPDSLDLDSDNDGIPDIVEAGGNDANDDGRIDNFTDANNDGQDDAIAASPLADADFDGDGLPNRIDLDSDNDGVADIIEAGGTDTDANAVVDGTFSDYNGNGWSSTFDKSNGGIPLDIPNTDGRSGADYLDLDSDDDGITDIIEAGGVDTNNDGAVDSTNDTDGDGWANTFDSDNGGTVLDDEDFDQDGSNNRIDLDSDNDGIADLVEAGGIDADNDGYVDGFSDANDNGYSENLDGTPGAGGTALPITNTDGTGNPNYLDIDSDDDGIVDVIEAQVSGSGLNTPIGIDTDGNGIDDSFDVRSTLSIPVDTDNDGTPDYIDADSDNDGVSDYNEAYDTDGNNVADVLPTIDTDGDGLLEGFDNIMNQLHNSASSNPNNGGQTSNSFPDNDRPATAERDWREINDNDNDGVADEIDQDDDNDGILDVNEGPAGTNPMADADGDGFPAYLDDNDSDAGIGNTDGLVESEFDADGDGIPNHFDLDSDNDGIADIVEAGGVDTDGNGTVDSFTDTDGDGIDDTYDANNGGTAIANEDADGDGINNFLDLDSDNDGIPDVIEVGGTDENGDGRADDFVDADNDGFNDVVDGDTNNDGVADNTGNVLVVTGPDAGNGAPDSYTAGDADGDGIPNYLDLDSDNDGLLDVVEAGGTDANGDGILDNFAGNDADGDGFNDAVDGDPTNALTPGDDSAGTNTNNALILTDADTNGDGTPDSYQNGDTDTDTVPDFLDLDSDNDGIADIVEAGGVDTDGNGTVDSFTDTDGDGIDDTYDANNGGTAIANPDTDGDGVADRLDLDSDNDGIPDVIEVGGTDENGDGRADDFVDADNDGFNDVVDGDTNNDGIADNTGNVLVVTGPDAGNGAPDSYTAGDADGDGIPNYLDLDSDNDGLLDVVEAGGTDANGDGILDNFTGNDADGDGFNDAVDGDPTNALTPGDDSAGTNTNNALILTDADTNGDGTPDSYQNGDTDTDTVPDFLDLDSDNDGIADIVEAGGVDTDGNGTVDSFTDTDGDGIDDTYDANNGGTAIANPDTDGDGIADRLDLDSDNDGIADVVEAGGTDENGDGRADDFVDADNDGFNDVVDGDTNNDGIADNTGNVLVVTGPDAGNGAPDSYTAGDADGDGIPNYLDLDSDNDGLLDVVEAGGTDANGDGILDNFAGNDADGDGFNDAVDGDPTNALTPGDDSAGTNTNNALILTDADTNGDGTPDSYQNGDTDTDTVPDFLDLDSDNDGIADIVEAGGVDTDGNGTVDSFTDTDGDGIDDTYDANNGGTAIANPDTDGDGIADRLDLDSDNDGIADVVEAGGTDENGDGRADDFVDADNDGFNDVVDGDTNNDGVADNTGNALVVTGPDAGNGAPGSYPTGDTDGDGVPNYLDLDSDNDGISDVVEAGGTDANGDGRADNYVDTDGDGFNDIVDGDPDNSLAAGDDNIDTNPGNPLVTTGPDANGDGTPDSYVDGDFDGDNVPNFLDLDSDNDGILDVTEAGGTDANNDGQADGYVDADGDGFNDLVDGDPTNSLPVGDDSNGTNSGNVLAKTGADTDLPLDGSPNSYPDADFDGDGNLNFLDIDSDNDGITDNAEGQPSDAGAFVSPSGNDTDGDGIDDAFDADNSGFGGAGSGIIPVDTDAASDPGTPDYLDTDSDDDGVADVIEGHDFNFNQEGDANSPASSGQGGTVDADGDGLLDGFDNNVGSPDPTNGGLNGESYAGITNPATAERDWREVADADNDGIRDDLDIDDDNDGIPDSQEGNGGTNPVADADGDGVPAYLDDNDSDPGIGNVDGLIESGFDTDGDGVPNHIDLDSDNDGIPDIIEAGGVDTDKDGRVDGFTDTDEDGQDDNLADTPLLDGDKDNDGIADRLDLDSDADGIADIIEAGGLDTDNDAKVDGADDNDYDGWQDIYDGDPLTGGTNLVLEDFDGDGIPNHLDADSDNDGISDNVEGQTTADFVAPAVSDADGDGWNDSYDSDDGGNAIVLSDNEGDARPDYLDLDSDGDTYPDWKEGFDDNGNLDALDDLMARAADFENNNGNPGYYDNSVDTDGDQIPDYLEDDDNDGYPNFLDPSETAYYRDSNNDGMIDLYDRSSGGASSTTPNNGGGTEPDFRNFGTNVALPIVLVSFDVEKVGRQTRLSWVTSYELNSDFFIIERSKDGIHFEEIIREKGAGFSEQTISYEVYDTDPMSGFNYYRLKQTDFNGETETFQIRVVEFDDVVGDYAVFPNPAKSKLYVRLEDLPAGEYQVELTSQLGQQIKQLDLTIDQGVSITKLEILQGLQVAKGRYMVKIIGNNTVQVFTVVIDGE